jgi:predicted nucleotide-binding protein
LSDLDSDPKSKSPITDSQADQPLPPSAAQVKPPSNRVFITHGRNKEIVAQIKELLSFGNFQPVISVEHETVSKPVPDKVMDEMRSCSAAIVHVGTEMKVLDAEGKEHRILNPNVLIEIGACMALYGRRFILLVERGVTLPSNLQGLYEVRYEGTTLDYEATMKLLKAFNDFKN